MKNTPRIRGVIAPVVTPFKADLSPDTDRYIAHCRWLVSQNCGLAVFGTNSEANSMSVDERIALLDVLLEAGIDPARMMPGTGSCALTDTVRLTEHAVRADCAGVLMLPPFFYKGVSDEGLYRSFSEVIERVGDARLRVYLYHIPQIAGVGITHGLIERLLKAYPNTIAGMKDSSGDWDNTQHMLDAFKDSGFDVFVGSESFLLTNMRNGGVGCISATANVNPGAIDRLYRQWQQPDADTQQGALDAVRDAFGQQLMVASLKAAIGHYANDPQWGSVRPPLGELTAVQASTVTDALDALGFDMPGLPQVAETA